MKTLDDAVIELNGVLPYWTSEKYAMDRDELYTPFVKNSFICTGEQFQQRAKELGFINGYRWGVEYKTDGKRPDLPDDVLVEAFYADEWREKTNFGILNWSADASWCIPIDAFRITDQRYKPADTSHLERPAPEPVPEEGGWWDYENDKPAHDGALPPVDYECEFSDSDFLGWRKCKYIGINSVGSKRFAVIFDSVKKDYINNWIAGDLKFRPLDYDRKAKAERKKVVDAALKEFLEFSGNASESLNHLYDKGFLKLPE